MRLFNGLPIPSIIEFNDQKVFLNGVIPRAKVKTEAHCHELMWKYRADEAVEGDGELEGWVLFIQYVQEAIFVDELLHENFKQLD